MTIFELLKKEYGSTLDKKTAIRILEEYRKDETVITLKEFINKTVWLKKHEVQEIGVKKENLIHLNKNNYLEVIN